ncbi:hypothetical protein WJX82_000665 [Trebouxia sp. C0006]
MTIQVTISCKESPGVHLEIALPRTTLGSSVLKQFCKEYSLSEQDCMLSCNGQSVNSSVIDCKKAQRLADVFKSKGILTVALAGLKYNGPYSTEKTMNLVLLLRCLVSSRFLHNIDKAENSITLLRMQGLMRISGLLCPPVLRPTADDLQEADDSEDPELAPQLQLTAQVAQLLVVLVKTSDGNFPGHDHLSNALFQRSFPARCRVPKIPQLTVKQQENHYCSCYIVAWRVMYWIQTCMSGQ